MKIIRTYYTPDSRVKYVDGSFGHMSEIVRVDQYLIMTNLILLCIVRDQFCLISFCMFVHGSHFQFSTKFGIALFNEIILQPTTHGMIFDIIYYNLL